MLRRVSRHVQSPCPSTMSQLLFVCLAGLILAGCYEPFPAAGAPCDVNAVDPCPSGQSCVRGTCRAEGFDNESVDAMTIPEIDAFAGTGSPTDLDGDGKPNTDDNCRNKPNPDQH